MTGRTHKSQSLDPDFIVTAYCHGYFPMAESRHGSISWYSPDPRTVIPLDKFVASRSLRQTLKKNLFEVRFNSAFEEVIRGCANRKETWISDEIITAYCELHRKGFAHSVESWRTASLAGGLYGVSIGGAFFGESMFSRESNASKVALFHLVQHLRSRRFLLLDSQFTNPHMQQFGAIEIPREVYLRLLRRAVGARTSFVEP